METKRLLPSIIARVQERNRETQLLILFSFLITFAFIRTVTFLQLINIIPNQTGVFHIHHMVPGIILVLICGYIGLAFWANTRVRIFVSVLFGVGAALTIDEFALWLFLRDVYWAKEGRGSIDAVILTATVLAIVFVISEVHYHAFLKQFVKRKTS